MAKLKSKWICIECGYETAGYLGKCPECGSWGSLKEEVQFNEKLPNASANEFVNTEKPKLLKEIEVDESGEYERLSANITFYSDEYEDGYYQIHYKPESADTADLELLHKVLNTIEKAE